MEMSPKKKTSQMNVWMVVSIILVIALVGMVVTLLTQKGFNFRGGSDGFVSADKASSDLITFINEIYSQQIGTVTFKSVVEKNGLYEVTFSMLENGVPTDQQVFITKDAKIFIPQVIIMDEMRQQYQAYLQQLQQAQAQPVQVEPTEEGDDMAADDTEDMEAEAEIE